MTSLLLIAAIFLLIPTVALLVYIMATERLWNLHKVWSLALRGHRMARFYIGLIAVVFLLALAGTISSSIDQLAAKGRSSAVGMAPPPN